MLGRETAIQKMKWTDDDWLVMADGSTEPKEYVEEPEGNSGATKQMMEAAQESTGRNGRDDFAAPVLDPDYQSLRIPMTEYNLSLTERPGYLRMYGRSGLSSKFSQTLIAKRLTEYDMDISTKLEFEPEVFKQMAGLILMYDTDNYLYLHVSRDEDCGKCIALLKAENKKYEYLTDYLPIYSGLPIYLKAEMQNGYITFSYRLEGSEWQVIAENIDGSFMSDEACTEGWFTGAMAGICCQDLTGFGKYADFDWFEMKTK